MRLENSMKNMKYNIISQVICLVVQFISRTFFVKILGSEYLGINGLFNNILTLLSLADMGIGTVLVYSMYEPLANKDKTKLKMLMNEYKKIYIIIALIVFILGICIVPFLHIFINDMPNIPNIRCIFILYLLNIVVSYLCIYKISIINADQKSYIVSVTQQIINIIANIFMTLILLVSRDFIAYLVIQIAFSIMSNIYISKKAEKMYPFIKETNGYKLNIEEKRKIKKDTFAMLLHKIGGVVVNGTDTLIMSAMIGLKEVGIYSNYLLIINSINRFTWQYFISMSASLGNMNVETSKEYLYSIFKKVFYGNFWIYTFCSICLYFLVNPFIEMWIGREYVFDYYVVFFIVLAFYVEGMRKTNICFREAMGMFTHDQLKPIIEAILNLIISIVLTMKFGIIGIILGTIISMLLTCTWVEPYVLFKYGFKLKVSLYFKMFFKYILIGIISFFATYFANELIMGNSIISFILRFCITIIISNTVIILATFRTEEFKYFWNIAKKIIYKKAGKFIKNIEK